MDKSHVSMESKRCIICDKEYESGSILLDTRLRKSMERHTVTGLGVCDEHAKKGYVVLVGIDPTKSDRDAGVVWRTGSVCHIKKSMFAEFFSKPCPDDFAFVDERVINKLEELRNASEKEEEDVKDEGDVSE
jgi:hypothetical protein